jgi:hypothetical protein
MADVLAHDHHPVAAGALAGLVIELCHAFVIEPQVAVAAPSDNALLAVLSVDPDPQPDHRCRHRTQPRLGFTPDVRFTGPVDTLLPVLVTGDLLAVVREALTNTARRAHASQAEVYTQPM